MLSSTIEPGRLSRFLEQIYREKNRPQFIDPDPLLLVRSFARIRDREIAGLLASGLAYGRVDQIMKAAASVLGIMGPSPYAYVRDRGERQMETDFSAFCYRFSRGEQVTALIRGMARMLKAYGSLEAGFSSGLDPGAQTVQPALGPFCRMLDPDRICGHLLPDPEKKSACKRLHLFLRWMVRQDPVDPGGWNTVPQKQLVVPLDLHMHRIATLLGFTRRKGADLKTAMEVTAGFARLNPADPVKYDFCLTRYGIREELDLKMLFADMA